MNIVDFVGPIIFFLAMSRDIHRCMIYTIYILSIFQFLYLNDIPNISGKLGCCLGREDFMRVVRIYYKARAMVIDTPFGNFHGKVGG